MMLLARTLGMTVTEIGEKVSSAELSLWMAEFNIEPWGEWRADLRTARQLHQNVEMNRDRTKNPEPLKLADFWPFKPKEPESDDKETARAAASGIVTQLRAAFGRKPSKD